MKLRPSALRRRLSPSVQGWTISVALHVLAAAVFVAISVGERFTTTPPRQPPQTFVAEPPEALRVTPVAAPGPALAPSMPTQTWDVPPAPVTPPPEAPPGDNLIAVAGDIGLGGTGIALATGDAGAATRFCGASGYGQRLCFVVDHSTSMIMAHEYIRRELIRAISHLTPGQYFNVVYYAEGAPTLLAPGRLLRASRPNRQRAIAFVNSIDMAPAGSADDAAQAAAVVQALTAAFAARNQRGQPVDLVYLLTDGLYDHEKVRVNLEQLQQQRRLPAVVNVLACGSRYGEDFLRQLVNTYGGEYRFLTDEETTSIMQDARRVPPIPH